MELDPHVCRSKFDLEIQRFYEASAITTARGCRLLEISFPTLRLEIVKMMPVIGASLPIVMVSARVDFTDFDIDPLSVTFVDPIGGQPSSPLFPIVQMINGEQRNLVIPSHPKEKRPFLCHAGVREYHSHDQHNGDEWGFHREQRRIGGLVWLADLLWDNCVSRIPALGVGFQLVAVQPGETNEA